METVLLYMKEAANIYASLVLCAIILMTAFAPWYIPMRTDYTADGCGIYTMKKNPSRKQGGSILFDILIVIVVLMFGKVLFDTFPALRYHLSCLCLFLVDHLFFYGILPKKNEIPLLKKIRVMPYIITKKQFL
jgi:hypothetical protein